MQQLANDLALGIDRDLVHDRDQQLDQPVGDRPLLRVQEHRAQGVAPLGAALTSQALSLVSRRRKRSSILGWTLDSAPGRCRSRRKASLVLARSTLSSPTLPRISLQAGEAGHRIGFVERSVDRCPRRG